MYGTGKTNLVTESSKIKLARYEVMRMGWIGEKEEENLPDKIQVIVFNFPSDSKIIFLYFP